MKATGIVRRIDDLGRVVIPKEIRRTLLFREGGPSQTTLTGREVFCFAMPDFCKRRRLENTESLGTFLRECARFFFVRTFVS